MTAADSLLEQRQPGRGSAAVRLAGVAGALGGAVLLAAFLVEIPPGLNDVRLVLFFVGAMAVGAAAYARLAATGRSIARVAVASVLIANAFGLAMTVASSVVSIPVGPGTFGVVYFIAGLAWWLADALFGLVSLRLGGWARLGALALAVGSLLAITGMDRLELTTRDNPTIFGPLGLLGVALNGLGWIVLGLWLAVGRRP